MLSPVTMLKLDYTFLDFFTRGVDVRYRYTSFNELSREDVSELIKYSEDEEHRINHIRSISVRLI